MFWKPFNLNWNDFGINLSLWYCKKPVNNLRKRERSRATPRFISSFRLNCGGINGMTLKNCFILECFLRLTQLDDRPENYLQPLSLSPHFPRFLVSFLRKPQKKSLQWLVVGKIRGRNIIVESRTSADAIARGGRGVSYGVSCNPQTARMATVPSASYKARAYAGHTDDSGLWLQNPIDSLRLAHSL